MSPAGSQTTYLVKLNDGRQVAERTMVFQFEKTEGFTFTAGQSIDLTLMNPPETDREGNGRKFSIASAPDEDLLLVATRMRDTTFKRVLGTLSIDSHVTIEGPFGNLVLHDDQARPGCSWRAGSVSHRSAVSCCERHESYCLIVCSSSLRIAGRKMPRFYRNWRPCNDKIRATHVSPP